MSYRGVTFNMTVQTSPSPSAAGAATEPYAGDRTGTILGVFAGVLGGGAILFFWSMGAIGLLTGNVGQIAGLGLEGFWRFAFFSYPFVLVAAVAVGAVLVALKRDLEAVGVFGLPVVAAVAYYLALIHLRPV
jgi:predicted lipid-binding transport protein (Tim44 family)